MYAQPLQALVEITKTKKLYDLKQPTTSKKQPETTWNNLQQPETTYNEREMTWNE